MKCNSFVFAPVIDQHLWDYICGLTEIQNGQTSKEEVHGRLEVVIEKRQQDNGYISHPGNGVEEKYNPRNNHLQLGLFSESKEYKSTKVAIIDHSFSFFLNRNSEDKIINTVDAT